jgi:hypothetical protein
MRRINLYPISKLYLRAQALFPSIPGSEIHHRLEYMTVIG